MVSILNWDQYNRHQRAEAFPSKYRPTATTDEFVDSHKNRVLKNAVDKGHLVKLTEDLIVGQKTDKIRQKSIEKVLFLSLIQQRIFDVQLLASCVSLKICILRKNFITDITPIQACGNLVELDLSSNQIEQLPDIWFNLPDLQVLYLHDNSLGSLENVARLSSAVNVEVLTLYDNPLCFHSNYRHTTVNLVWSLKVLDKHVISDEEIIEDLKFTSGRYSTFAKPLEIDVVQKYLSRGDYKQEAMRIIKLLKGINRVQSKLSPVIVVQKYVRAFLARLRARRVRRQSKSQSGGTLPSTPVSGQKHPSELGMPPSSPNGDALLREDSLLLIDLDPSLADEEHQGSPPAPKRNIIINLAKLHRLDLQRSPSSLGTVAYLQSGSGARKDQKAIPQPVRDATSPPPPTPEFQPVLELPYLRSCHMNLDENIAQFRLMGLKKTIELINPRDELRELTEINVAAVQSLKAHSHRPKDNGVLQKYEPLAKKKGNEKTMKLSSLFAVENAYKMRNNAVKRQEVIQTVAEMKDKRDTAKESIKLYKQYHRDNALRQKQLDRQLIIEQQQKQEDDELAGKSEKLKKIEKEKITKREVSRTLTFVGEFARQNTSVGSALQKYDFRKMREDQMEERHERVETSRVVNREQQEIVKDYLEHRRMMQRSLIAKEKRDIDHKIFVETSHRMMEARRRVEQQQTMEKREKMAFGGSVSILPPISYSRASVP